MAARLPLPTRPYRLAMMSFTRSRIETMPTSLPPSMHRQVPHMVRPHQHHAVLARLVGADVDHRRRHDVAHRRRARGAGRAARSSARSRARSRCRRSSSPSVTTSAPMRFSVMMRMASKTIVRGIDGVNGSVRFRLEDVGHDLHSRAPLKARKSGAEGPVRPGGQAIDVRVGTGSHGQSPLARARVGRADSRQRFPLNAQG